MRPGQAPVQPLSDGASPFRAPYLPGRAPHAPPILRGKNTLISASKEKNENFRKTEKDNQTPASQASQPVGRRSGTRLRQNDEYAGAYAYLPGTSRFEVFS